MILFQVTVNTLWLTFIIYIYTYKMQHFCWEMFNLCPFGKPNCKPRLRMMTVFPTVRPFIWWLTVVMKMQPKSCCVRVHLGGVIKWTRWDPGGPWDPKKNDPKRWIHGLRLRGVSSGTHWIYMSYFTVKIYIRFFWGVVLQIPMSQANSSQKSLRLHKLWSTIWYQTPKVPNL